MSNTNCQICDGPNEVLGMLGDVQHYRCRNCGAQSHRVVTMVTAECDGFNCKNEIRIADTCEDEAYCETCYDQRQCAEEGHCRHPDCRQHNVCCGCDCEDIGYDGPESEYDTIAEWQMDHPGESYRLRGLR